MNQPTAHKPKFQAAIAARKQEITQAEQLRQKILFLRDAAMQGRADKEQLFLALNEFATYLRLYSGIQEGLIAIMETFPGAKPAGKNNIYPLRKVV